MGEYSWWMEGGASMGENESVALNAAKPPSESSSGYIVEMNVVLSK